MGVARCQICGKGALFGHQISHAHNVTKKRQYPNVQRMRVLVDGASRSMYVCTRCLRSGRVQKAG